MSASGLVLELEEVPEVHAVAAVCIFLLPVAWGSVCPPLLLQPSGARSMRGELLSLGGTMLMWLWLSLCFVPL